MTKSFVKFSWIFIIAVAAFLTSCEQDNALTDTVLENFTNSSVETLERQGNCGRRGCFEFVFPITIAFPDETTAEVNSYDELKESIRTWKENNPDSEEKPNLVFPIEVINEEGEVISVADMEELKALASECRPRGGHGGGGRHCFKPVFPLSIAFPDGTIAEAENRRALKQLVREWKENNPDSEERPQFVFPIDVEMEDGTVVTVESAEDLEALKESCMEN